jgi:hypothetical protein
MTISAQLHPHPNSLDRLLAHAAGIARAHKDALMMWEEDYLFVP